MEEKILLIGKLIQEGIEGKPIEVSTDEPNPAE